MLFGKEVVEVPSSELNNKKKESKSNRANLFIYFLFIDLRQDMLTILSLRIMENLWRKAGLEYGLIPYKCLSTGNKIGLIEVVRPAETLARIQAEIGGRFGVLREASLYKWIATNHVNESE